MAAHPGLDYEAVFDDIPTPYMLLTPDLTIVAVNRAYEQATGISGAGVVRRPLFEAFPDNPDDPAATGVANLGASLERVLATGRVDVMPVQKYDVADSSGGFSAHWWSPVNAPVRDDAGDVTFLLHRVEEVTEYVLARRDRAQPGGATGPAPEPEAWDAAETDLWVRGEELRRALNEEEAAAQRLARLVEVTLRLASTTSVADLIDVVVHRGLAVLGAEGGAVAVADDRGDGWDLALTDSLGEDARTAFSHIPRGSSLPVAVAARTNRRVLLQGRDEAVAFSPHMAEALTTTGLATWLSVPLVAGGRTLGAITTGWREPQDFTDRDLDVVEAFAAQCAATLARLQADERQRLVDADERAMSESLQRSLLSEPIQPDHLTIAVRYLPAAQGARIGGDWYDCYLAPDGTTTLVVGDVAGHDREAAAAMGQVRNVLRGICVAIPEPPAAVLSALDRGVQVLDMGLLATAVLAQVQQSPEQARHGQRTLHWSNAGHPPPVLIPPDGRARLLEGGEDLLLGFDPATDRYDHQVVLDPGSTVVLYTDGLVERRDQPLQAGLQWLLDTLDDLRDLSAEDLCDALLAHIGDSHEDDTALLVLHAHPEDRPAPADEASRSLAASPPGSLRTDTSLRSE